MTFNPNTSPQDYIVLAGRKSPGVAELQGASSPREWDERGGYGVTGSFSIFKRRGLSHFSVKLTLTTDTDWQEWAEWKPIVDKLPTKRGGTTPASGFLQIEHPILADLNITAVGVEDVGQPVQTDHGIWEIVIKFIEFRSPKTTLAKPEETKSTPQDPYDKKIEELTDQFDRLANE